MGKCLLPQNPEMIIMKMEMLKMNAEHLLTPLWGPLVAMKPIYLIMVPETAGFDNWCW